MPYDSERHGPVRVVGPGFHERVAELVRRIPKGSVTTYGDIAGALGFRAAARHVGFALAALPDGSDVPWHRVVDRTGRIPGRDSASRQHELLQGEGHTFDERGRLRDFLEVRFVFGDELGDGRDES
jgi:methylated-DNA-protein-cysteine methyltransferase-like protein